jgi:hypothetical protein
MENENGIQGWPVIRPTLGEILPGGVVYELVQSRSGRGVELLRWEAETYEIAPQFKESATLYTPDYLPPSLFGATWFAREPAEYGLPSHLFWKVADLFCRYMGFSRELAAFMTGVVFCSWFPDCCARPMTLCITGDMDQVMKLFRLLRAVCRRALVVAELSLSLPFILCPTLLINVLKISARAAGRWRASNYCGAFIPGARGTLRNIACTKIIFCETEAAREVWGPEAMHVALLPTTQELAALTEQEEADLAAEYQPQFLMFRLRNLSSIHRSGAGLCQPKFAGFELRGNLLACIAEDPEIVKAWTPLLEAHEQELLTRRSRNPGVAAVETVWAPAHKQPEMSTEQITQRVDALLRKRGEILPYNSKQIGWKLRELGLDRQNNGKFKVVRFSREIRSRIHQLAAQFGLKLPKVPGCADCEAMQVVAEK